MMGWFWRLVLLHAERNANICGLRGLFYSALAELVRGQLAFARGDNVDAAMCWSWAGVHADSLRDELVLYEAESTIRKEKLQGVMS